MRGAEPGTLLAPIHSHSTSREGRGLLREGHDCRLFQGRSGAIFNFFFFFNFLAFVSLTKLRVQHYKHSGHKPVPPLPLHTNQFHTFGGGRLFGPAGLGHKPSHHYKVAVPWSLKAFSPRGASRIPQQNQLSSALLCSGRKNKPRYIRERNYLSDKERNSKQGYRPGASGPG